MSDQIVINHVMSTGTTSIIFQHILDYFKNYAPENFIHISSITAINEANIWHYHRPQLEGGLMQQSIVTVHHDLEDTDAAFDIKNFLPRYHEAKKVVCLNTTQRDILKKHGIHHTHVVPHGFNPEVIRFRGQKKLKDKYTFLITSRRYGRRVKGESYFIELLEYLDPNLVRFYLVGTDRTIDAHYLDRFGFEYKIFERLPYPLYGNLYAEADFLFMPSLYEGGPANIPEAIASGTPVICNPIAMARDLIVSGNNGLWLTMCARQDAHTINTFLSNSNAVQQTFDAAGSTQNRNRAITWQASILANHDVYKEMLA